MVKYILYCRKSTDEKDRQVLSIEAQIAELTEFAKRENLTVLTTVVESKTAKEPGREKFAQMLALIEGGSASGILSWHPDRLARNSVDGGRIVYLLDTGKLQSLKFPTFWFENTPQGKFMLSIAFGQSKYYVDNLAENVKRGLRQKLRNGVWPSKAILGYVNNPKTRGIDVDPATAPVVKKAYELFSQGNKGYADIARFLAQNGIVCKNGRPWYIERTKRLLTNRFYIGIFSYFGQHYQGSHQCFISKNLFEKAKQHAQEIDRPRNGRRHKFVFTNFARCGECGAGITAEVKHKFYKRTNHAANYIYYRCTHKLGPCSQRGGVREEILEEDLRRLLLSVALPQDWQKPWLNLLAQDEVLEKENANKKMAELQNQILILDQKTQILLDGFLDGTIDPEIYKQKKNELFENKLKLQQDLAKIESKGSTWIEPFREFINRASELEKVARAKKNSEDLRIFAQSAGSNFFLKDGRLGAVWLESFAALRTERGVRSAATCIYPKYGWADSAGFEPVVSSVTGRRDNRYTTSPNKNFQLPIFNFQ